MLGSWLWILVMGFFVGQIVGRLGMPPLLGMILVGILLGDVLSPEVLAAAVAPLAHDDVGYLPLLS